MADSLTIGITWPCVPAPSILVSRPVPPFTGFICQDAWFFDSGYIPWAVRCVVEELQLQPGDSFVDIGGGTGNYTKLIAEEACLKGRGAAVNARHVSPWP